MFYLVLLGFVRLPKLFLFSHSFLLIIYRMRCILHTIFWDASGGATCTWGKAAARPNFLKIIPNFLLISNLHPVDNYHCTSSTQFLTFCHTSSKGFITKLSHLLLSFFRWQSLPFQFFWLLTVFHMNPNFLK